MRDPIYTPKGAAREYGELALNIYTGCPHRCFYCYAPNVLHCNREAFHSHVEPRPGIVEAVREQLRRTEMTGKTVHLCFTCDPFPAHYNHAPTLQIIRMLKEYGNNVQILTKGHGTSCFGLLNGNDWYGISFDGTNGLSGFLDIEKAHEQGIKTWASFEPVLCPETVLDTIRWAHTWLDSVKIGKLTYRKPPEPVDWAAFGREAEALCQELGLDYYIKDSLRKEMDSAKR